jgi:hypothetical protein
VNRAHHFYCSREAWKRHVREDLVPAALEDADRVRVREGDGTSREGQDRLFSEVRRVVRPGGTFAGTDSTGRGVGFALLHVGDVRNVFDPRELPSRLQTAGFGHATVDWDADTIRFRAL